MALAQYALILLDKDPTSSPRDHRIRLVPTFKKGMNNMNHTLFASKRSISKSLWRLSAVGVLATLGSLAGCHGTHAAASTDQAKLCTFSSDLGAKRCKDGELAHFAPRSWGNEQLPLNVIAAYCNTNRPLEFNQAGVVCTFTDKRLWLLQPQGRSKQ